MTQSRIRLEPPALALQRQAAAAALDMGVDAFDQWVRPYVRVVYAGGMRLWPVEELRGWLERNAKELP